MQTVLNEKTWPLFCFHWYMFIKFKQHPIVSPGCDMSKACVAWDFFL